MLTYGSVRGVPGDRHPYRDPFFASGLPPGPLFLLSEFLLSVGRINYGSSNRAVVMSGRLLLC